LILTAGEVVDICQAEGLISGLTCSLTSAATQIDFAPPSQTSTLRPSFHRPLPHLGYIPLSSTYGKV